MNHLMRAALFVAVAPIVTMSFAAETSKNQGYLTDRNGNAVSVRTSGCVRSRDWTPSRANKQCEHAITTTSAPGRPTR